MNPRATTDSKSGGTSGFSITTRNENEKKKLRYLKIAARPPKARC